MPSMTDEEIKEFLKQPLIAKLATFNPDGTIRITPLWFEARDDLMVMNTFEANPHVQNLKRDPRASVLIETTTYPYRYVQFTGQATVETEDSSADQIARMYTRYMGGYEQAKQYADQLVSSGKRVSIRFRPERKRSVDFTKVAAAAR